MVSVNVYEKFEQSFTITGTTATRLHKPYDAAAPAGITNNGISVDAQFLPPGVTDWTQAITHPCFYFQPETVTIVGSNQQVLPTSGASPLWKVRWSPKNPLQTGTWNWRVRTIDGNGTNFQAQPQFTVTAPVRKGFIKVSTTDTRRFEYSNGTNFIGIGVNDNPNYRLASKYTNVGIDWLRVWLSNLLPLGGGSGDNIISTWQPLNAPGFFAPAPATPPSPFGFHLTGGANASAVFTFNTSTATAQAFPSCRRATQYQFSFYVRTSGINVTTGKVTLKIAAFATAANVSTILASPVATLLTTTAGSAPTTWTQFVGTYTTGATDDYFGAGGNYIYLALEGSTTGTADVVNLTCQEVLGGGNFGPNQFDFGNGDMDSYSHVGSAIMDSLIADAESKNISLKLVLEDKGETVWTYLNPSGTISASSNGDLGAITAMSMTGSTVTVTVNGSTAGLIVGAWVSIINTVPSFGYVGQWQVATIISSTQFTFTSNASGQPTPTTLGNVSQANFYNGLSNTQTGWYHKAFLRYVCARWGYSTAVHSWEHINEGDGGSGQQTFTNSWASSLKALDVHNHPVSTSTQVGVHTPFWAAMTNVDFMDSHDYNDTGDLRGTDWYLPPIDSAATTFWTQPSAGAIQKTCTVPSSYNIPFACQEIGTYTVQMTANAALATGGTFGFTGEGMNQTIAAGTGATVLSSTFTPTLVNGQYTANIIIGAGTATGGTGQISNLSVTCPSGKRLFILIGDGSFPLLTDTTRDTATFISAYNRYLSGNKGYSNAAGQGVYNKPSVIGEWSPGTTSNPPNTFAAWVASDTNLVWLHCALFAQLAPGGVFPLWWNLGTNPIDANNGWSKFTPLSNFLTGIPLNNGNYVDIGATATSQTNGTVVVLGQKDTSNNQAHLWVRQNSFTAYNAVNAPTAWLPGGVAGQILTGTVSFTGLANGNYALTTTEFTSAGAITITTSSVQCSGGVISLNLATLTKSTSTDVAFSLVFQPVNNPPVTIFTWLGR